MTANLTVTWATHCRCLSYRIVLVLASVVALAGCAKAPQIDSIDESLRVASLDVVVPETSKHGDFNWAPGGIARTFPPDKVGLTKNMISSDFATGLRREIIPASANGQRAVNVLIEIYNLNLRGPEGFSDPTQTLTSIVAVMDVKDATTGEYLIAEEWITLNEISREWKGRSFGERVRIIQAVSGKKGNYIRSYDILLKEFPIEIKRRLLK